MLVPNPLINEVQKLFHGPPASNTRRSGVSNVFKLGLAISVLLLVTGPLFLSRASWLSDVTGVNIDLNKQVGTGIEAMSAPTVDAFEQAGGRLIQQADQTFGKRLDQFSQIAAAQLQSANQILTGAISSIDADISKQLGDADELLEKRLGNIDTIAAKSAMTVEDVVARLILLGCIMIFAACAVWRLYVLGLPSWTAERDHSFFKWLRGNWWSLTWQLGGAAVAVGLLFGVFWLTGPHGNISKLTDQHDQAYRTALKALDFRQARYHAAQLKILDPSNESYLGYELKANLLQDVLMRPALYQTLAGLRELSFRMSQAQTYLAEDPDIRVVGALLAWNSGGTRAHQYIAAVLCNDALTRHTHDDELKGDFVLRPLAIEYLKNYLLNPIPNDLTKLLLPPPTTDESGSVKIAIGSHPSAQTVVKYPSTEELHATLQKAEELPKGAAANGDRLTEASGPMSHLIKFDQIVRTLYRQEIPAYIKMLEADRKFNNPAFASEKAQQATLRQNAARTIASAWQMLDQILATDTDLADSSATIRSMMLNDVILTKADAYTNYTADDKTNKVAYSSADHQAFIASYIDGHLTDDTTGKVKQYLLAQKAAMGAANDKDLSDFAAAMVEVDKMANGQPTGTDFTRAKAAAILAAKLGLFTCGSEDCKSESVLTTQFASSIKDTYSKDHPDASENALFAANLDPDLRLAYKTTATILW